MSCRTQIWQNQTRLRCLGPDLEFGGVGFVPAGGQCGGEPAGGAAGAGGEGGEGGEGQAGGGEAGEGGTEKAHQE